MSTQDKLERVLRDIHVLISRSELYDNTGEKIIVEKKKMFEYLNHLNACIYEMMDEYEVTQQSRDKAEREARKKGDAMIFKASRNAEDVYAAAVLYTDSPITYSRRPLSTTSSPFFSTKVGLTSFTMTPAWRTRSTNRRLSFS